MLLTEQRAAVSITNLRTFRHGMWSLLQQLSAVYNWHPAPCPSVTVRPLPTLPVHSYSTQNKLHSVRTFSQCVSTFYESFCNCFGHSAFSSKITRCGKTCFSLRHQHEYQQSIWNRVQKKCTNKGQINSHVREKKSKYTASKIKKIFLYLTKPENNTYLGPDWITEFTCR